MNFKQKILGADMNINDILKKISLKKVSRIAFAVGGVSTVLMLSGCAGMPGDPPTCPKEAGQSTCMSLDEVNQKIDQHALPNMDANSTGAPIDTKDVDLNAGYKDGKSGFWATTPTEGSPIRYGETVQNIWIAPYVDKEGTYNWPSVVTIVLRPAHWVGAPVTAIQLSGEEQ